MGCIFSQKKKHIVEIPVDHRLPVCYKELNETFDNDTEFINNLVKQGNEEFLTSVENMIETVRTQGLVDLDSIKLHCHSIKGSAATITCFRLSDIAKDVEDFIESMNSLNNNNNSEIIIKYLNLMKTEITEILKTKNQYI